MRGGSGRGVWVRVNGEVLEGVLQYCRDVHPREAILLLRGRGDGEEVCVEEVVVPPGAVHGTGFSDFRPQMIPFDLSLVGVAHSHPSGVRRPSIFDLNHVYGRVMLIIAYPYLSRGDVAFYDRRGRMLGFEVT